MHHDVSSGCLSLIFSSFSRFCDDEYIPTYSPPHTALDSLQVQWLDYTDICAYLCIVYIFADSFYYADIVNMYILLAKVNKSLQKYKKLLHILSRLGGKSKNDWIDCEDIKILPRIACKGGKVGELKISERSNIYNTGGEEKMLKNIFKHKNPENYAFDATKRYENIYFCPF